MSNKLKFDGKYLLNGSTKIGYIDSDNKTAKDAKGSKVGYIDGDKIKSLNGSTLTQVEKDKFRINGKTIYLKDIHIEGLPSATKTVAFYVLFLM